MSPSKGKEARHKDQSGNTNREAISQSPKGKLGICEGAEVRGRVKDEESPVNARGRAKVVSCALGNDGYSHEWK